MLAESHCIKRNVHHLGLWPRIRYFLLSQARHGCGRLIPSVRLPIPATSAVGRTETALANAPCLNCSWDSAMHHAMHVLATYYRWPEYPSQKSTNTLLWHIAYCSNPCLQRCGRCFVQGQERTLEYAASRRWCSSQFSSCRPGVEIPKKRSSPASSPFACDSVSWP